MEKNVRKYTVTFTVEETEDRRLPVQMDEGPFLRTVPVMAIAGCIMENFAKSNNVPIETVLANFCKGCIAQHDSIRLVEQQNDLRCMGQ